ncbi:zinc finger protein 862-like [Montipora foliosa]|uniref:zinc finger protein 862-like n=1 Tax=Montipora foliosa TaxID=591990 RepID=UPI0035F1C61B
METLRHLTVDLGAVDDDPEHTCQIPSFRNVLVLDGNKKNARQVCMVKDADKSFDVAEAEEVQYPNNPPAQVALAAQEPQVPAGVPNEQRDVENAQPHNYEIPRASVRVRSSSSSSLSISIHSGIGESLSLFMSKRKAPESTQPGIESFLSKSKQTEGNGGSDKATSERRPANLVSVSSAARIQPVTDKTVMLKLLKKKFPECIDGDKFHSFYQCTESCTLKEPAFQSSLKETSKRIHRFQHSWLFSRNENHNAYDDESTGIWWLVYDENQGMFCVLCRSHNTTSPTNGDGTWNSKPCVRNITQAIKLHANSEMHKTAINKEHLQRVSPFHKEVQQQETMKNEVLVKVFSSLYWLAKEEIANKKATQLIELLERLGLEEMRHFKHRSRASIREVFLFLGKAVKNRLITDAASSDAFGCLADEVTDISVLQQFVVFVKYVNSSGKPQTDFLHTQHMANGATGEELAKCLKNIVQECQMELKKMKSCVTDGAGAMIGRHNGMAAIIKRDVPDLINIHCVCHRLALACADASKELSYIKKVEGLLLQVWKFYEYSPKKTAKFAIVQGQLLNLLPKEQLSEAKKHMKKAKKAVASRWLSFDASVGAMIQEFIAHPQTFEFFKEEDATACGLLTQTRCHKFIGAIYILKEVLAPLAVLSKTLQQGELSFAGLPPAVSYCLAKLDDVLKRKDVILATLSDDLAENGKFGLAGIQITEASTTFLGGLLTIYVAKLKENISARFPSLPLVQAFSIFDLQRLPAKEATDFKTYGVNHVATLADHFGVTEYVDVEALKSEWEHFKFVAQDLKTECPMTTTPQPGNTPTEWLLTKLCSISSFKAMFPNLVKLATVAQTLPVTNAWPERGASALKRIKTRLRNSLKDDMLESLLQITINGPSVSQAKDVVEQAVGLWLQEKQ